MATLLWNFYQLSESRNVTFNTCLGVRKVTYLQAGVKVLSLPPDRCESIFYTALDTARAVSYEK